MARVADIIAAKGGGICRVEPTTSAFAAVAEMVNRNVGSMLVTDGDEIVGVFTERDYLRRVTLLDRDPHRTPVSQVMTTHIICVEPSRSIEECMAIMTQERIRHLPVVDDDAVVGIISIGDLAKFMSKEREVEIRYLTEYITGGR